MDRQPSVIKHLGQRKQDAGCEGPREQVLPEMNRVAGTQSRQNTVLCHSETRHQQGAKEAIMSNLREVKRVPGNYSKPAKNQPAARGWILYLKQFSKTLKKNTDCTTYFDK